MRRKETENDEEEESGIGKMMNFFTRKLTFEDIGSSDTEKSELLVY